MQYLQYKLFTHKSEKNRACAQTAYETALLRAEQMGGKASKYKGKVGYFSFSEEQARNAYAYSKDLKNLKGLALKKYLQNGRLAL